MERRPSCYVIESDEGTDSESSPSLEDDKPSDKFNLCQKVFCVNDPIPENKTEFPVAKFTIDIQEFNEKDGKNLPTCFEGNEAQTQVADDFEFDFQSIDEAEQTEQILKVRVHANFCMRCGTGFVQQKRLIMHLEKNECSPNNYCSEMPLTCSICGRGFYASSCLRQHVMLHAQTKPFKCKKCSRSFVTQRDLFTHYQIHNTFRPFICNLCPKAFFSIRNLSAHRKDHIGQRPYSCGICPKRFNKAQNLMAHKRRHASKKPFKCKFCNRRYPQNSLRNLHMRTHTRNTSADLNFLCEICGLNHIRSRSTLIKFYQTPERKISSDSVISIEDEDSDTTILNAGPSECKNRKRKLSTSSDSVQIIEDPLQFTIDLID